MTFLNKALSRTKTPKSTLDYFNLVHETTFIIVHSQTFHQMVLMVIFLGVHSVYCPTQLFLFSVSVPENKHTGWSVLASILEKLLQALTSNIPVTFLGKSTLVTKSVGETGGLVHYSGYLERQCLAWWRNANQVWNNWLKEFYSIWVALAHTNLWTRCNMENATLNGISGCILMIHTNCSLILHIKWAPLIKLTFNKMETASLLYQISNPQNFSKHILLWYAQNH